MAKHTFKQSTATGDTRIIARSALGYDWNYLADAETLLFGSTDETAFRMQNITAGTGITTGTGTLYKANVCVAGDLITTTIVMDITGLNSGHNTDIIGVDATANSHIGQVTAALNGTIFAGEMTCLETPAGGEPDIDLVCGDEATGTEDAVYTGLTNSTKLFDAGQDWVGGLHANQYQTAGLTAMPAADQYLYLSTGNTDNVNDTYTAGKFKIVLYGYPS